MIDANEILSLRDIGRADYRGRFDTFSGCSMSLGRGWSALRCSRSVVFCLGIMAWVLGTFFPSVLAIQMYSYTMYGAAITPAVLAAFLWRRATAAGGIASILMGGGGTLLWELGLQRPMGWNSVLFSLPLSVGALVFVSLLTADRRYDTNPSHTNRNHADLSHEE